MPGGGSWIENAMALTIFIRGNISKVWKACEHFSSFSDQIWSSSYIDTELNIKTLYITAWIWGNQSPKSLESNVFTGKFSFISSSRAEILYSVSTPR